MIRISLCSGLEDLVYGCYFRDILLYVVPVKCAYSGNVTAILQPESSISYCETARFKQQLSFCKQNCEDKNIQFIPWNMSAKGFENSMPLN